MFVEQFKRVQVIMLPTNEKPIKGQILRRHIWKEDPKLECDSLWLYNNTVTIDNLKQYTTLNSSFTDWYKAFEPQHLYIISDDKIKEGGWYFDGTDFIHKKSKHNNTLVDGNKQAKKIIATTDTSLINRRQMTFMDEATEWIYDLPQPSQQFIEKYIEEYNKGNIITDVLVEYETLKTTANNKHFGEGHIYSITNKLKINPKDNTITIKKLKDNFTINEIEKALINTKLLTNNEFKDIWKVMKENLNLG